MPFPPQAALSGYGKAVPPRFTYTKSFTLPENFAPPRARVLLHFGAVDQIAEVSLNGRLLARHEGGYLPFTVEVTAALAEGENKLAVAVTDTLSHKYPYGKQRKRRGGMWYTPVSGIWQTVWMEAVPEIAVEALKITPDLTGVTLEVQTPAQSLTLALLLPAQNKTYRRDFTFADNAPTKTIRLSMTEDATGEPPRFWTPDDPYLYHFVLRAGQNRDEVHSYFALRTIETKTVGGVPRICLNGEPVFLHGVLDQGYFSDGLYLPAAPAGYAEDIRGMKALGFNLLRKHCKVEPESFYAACDRLGMLVLQDMVNSGGYSWLWDTALPNLGRRTRRDAREWHIFGNGGRGRRAFFLKHATDTQAHLYSHPCVIGYTVFNEGWGQFDSDAAYAMLKQQDPTRFYDAASGWFAQGQSDVESPHLYFTSSRTPAQAPARPYFISECGGFGWQVEGHRYSKYAQLGYGFAHSSAELTEKLVAMYKALVLPGIPTGVCGCIYTQLSDVEDELNGLYTYDRALCKVEAAPLRALAAQLKDAMQQEEVTHAG